MQSARLPLLAALAFPASPAAGTENTLDDLYSAMVIVTGRDNLAERQRGIAEALTAVLVRVSADPGVGQRFDERGDRGDPAADVTGLDYFDRKEGIQISDEQGARDRSFELTVTFDAVAIDALLLELGAQPWPAPRPHVPVDLTVHTQARDYRLTENGDDGYSQRLSLLDAADDLGLTVELPVDDASSVGGAGLTGEMRMTPAGLWTSHWRFGEGPAAGTHTVEDRSFDETFESALAFAAGLKPSR